MRAWMGFAFSVAAILSTGFPALAQTPTAFEAASAAFERGDYVTAAKEFRLAADQGNATAQTILGVLLADGQGVPQNYAEAARWYRLAADQGDADAQFALGFLFANGQGVPQNYPEAARLYRLAADQGHASAQYHLGGLFYIGQGVPQNYAEAARWYRLAANQGNAPAQGLLGAIFFLGQGVPQSVVDAYKWFNLAAASGEAEAAKMRDLVLSQMTPAQIAEGQRLASAWRPKLAAAPTPTPAAAPAPAAPPAARAPAPKPAPRSTSSPGPAATGSGFLVSLTGHILTNAHVIKSCGSLTLRDGRPLTLIARSTDVDLALLKANGLWLGNVLAFRADSRPRLAEDVLVAGYPLTGLVSSDLSVTSGSISAVSGPGDDLRMFQMTAPIQPGNSGGPVIDKSGNVVGVVVSKLDELKVVRQIGSLPQNVNFAIAGATAQEFLRANGVNPVVAGSQAPKPNTEVADIARRGAVQVVCYR